MGLGNSLFNLFHGSKVKALEGIPGPEPTWPLGNVSELSGQEKWEYFGGLRSYGPVSVFWALGSPMIVVNDAALVKDVLIDNRDAYYKDAPREALTPLGGSEFVFFLNGEEHSKGRAADPLCRSEIVPAWYTDNTATLHAHLQTEVAAALASGGPVEMLDLIRQVTYRCFTLLTVGDPIPGGFGDFMGMADKGDKRLSNPLQLKLPLGGAFTSAKTAFLGVLQTQIEANKAAGLEGRTDLASVYAALCAHIPNEMLALQMSRVHFGGVFSTGSSILGCLRELARHPDALATLRTELDALGDAPSYEDLIAAPFLDAVVRETLRLWCPVPLYTRHADAEKGTTLGGHTLPPTTQILITNWAIQRNPDTYPEPESWTPARWTDELKAAHPIGSPELLPLGLGPRECLGKQMALLCIKATVAAFARGADLAVDESGHASDFFFAVLAPKGLQGTFTPRA